MKERFGRDQEMSDLLSVLGTRQGRRVVWRLMSKCRVFSSVWENSARIHYNSGQQDIGHFLMAEVVEANPHKLIEMMKESKEDEDNG